MSRCDECHCDPCKCRPVCESTEDDDRCRLNAAHPGIHEGGDGVWSRRPSDPKPGSPFREVKANATRPEWVKCIQHYLGPYANETPALASLVGKTWCGRFEPGWAFQGLGHAAYNGVQKGRMVACPECVDAVAKALRHGL